ncbi:sensor histidine kinase [Patulibacter sp.]|uniref:sensor histidine kinase n=1 Tax=Patulibacter sp. TaxID=1912859 RepID=UPI00272196E1|nr:ATP-binding protein [Patulibacter sp.]MDO9407239.1 ATP-binding protein [Patulibacter sp.]
MHEPIAPIAAATPGAAEDDVVAERPSSPVPERDPSPVGTTLARLAGAATTIVLVLVADERASWLIPVFAASVVWFALSTAHLLLRRWSLRQARLVGTVDLAFIVAAVAASGETESPVLRILCLAPAAWAVITDRTTTALLIVLGGVAFGAVWAHDVRAGAEQPWESFATFASIYLSSSAIAYVALRLRDGSRAYAERLAAARRALTQELGQVERDERERLAVQLHDGPLQTIISARQDLVDHLDGDPDALEIGISTLDESIVSLREVTTDVFPDQDGGSVVREQLRSIAGAWESRGDFEVRVVVDDEVGARSDPMLVGMVAELVGNAAKHASPSIVLVDLRGTGDGVALKVTDDGTGMTRADRLHAEETGHIGLRSLNRRIQAVGGRLQIRSAPGRGTSVRVLLPR